MKRLEELERGSAEYLAWKEIEDRRAELNLDVFQTNQAGSKRVDADRAVDLRLAETYQWCLVPHQPDPTGAVEWEAMKADGQGLLAARTSRKLVNAGSLGVAYSSELLRTLLGTGGVLSPMWAEGYTSVNLLWDAFARYPYLPRLKSIDTLSATARQGANPIAWEVMGFALADAVDSKSGRFIGLTTNGEHSTATGTTLVVSADVAAPQLAEEAAAVAATEPTGTLTPLGRGPEGESPQLDDALRRFYAVVKLDAERYQRDFAKLAAEVISNLAGYLGTDVEISVEVKATNPEGFPEHVTRTVTENARTLKLDSYGFETE